MAGTRSSDRLSQNKSSPQSAEKPTSGTKRKADDASPSTKSKRGRPSKGAKEQKTLEETLPAADEEAKDEGVEMEDAEIEDAGAEDEQANGDANGETHEKTAATESNTEESKETATTEAQTDGSKNDAKNAFDQVKADEGDQGTTSKEEEKGAENSEAADVKADAVEEDKEREKAVPSNILEKGIIYFFTRGRVGVEDPSSVQELQRSYFVLRPLPDGAKLTEGAIQDVGNNRLIALPKKVWPKSGKDRFMVFVEKSKTSMEALKEEFFQGSTYSTKTVGTRHTPEVTPIGEGVYAITSTGGAGRGTTHLAYMLTIPQEIGEVQTDVGLADKGSFILSVKNPEAPSGPQAQQLPPTAQYPKEILEEFGTRAWAPAEPKHIDYDGASVLMIGESFDSGANVEADQKGGSEEAPKEEIEKLEHEDELRVEALKGDDTIFADLGISSKDYPKVMTTW